MGALCAAVGGEPARGLRKGERALRDFCKSGVEKRRAAMYQLPTMLAAMFTHSPSTETLK